MFVSELVTIVSKLVYIISFITAAYLWSLSFMTSSCVTWYCITGALFKAVCMPNQSLTEVKLGIVVSQVYKLLELEMTSWWCHHVVLTIFAILIIYYKSWEQSKVQYLFFTPGFYSQKPNTLSLFTNSQCLVFRCSRLWNSTNFSFIVFIKKPTDALRFNLLVHYFDWDFSERPKITEFPKPFWLIKYSYRGRDANIEL